MLKFSSWPPVRGGVSLSETGQAYLFSSEEGLEKRIEHLGLFAGVLLTDNGKSISEAVDIVHDAVDAAPTANTHIDLELEDMCFLLVSVIRGGLGYSDYSRAIDAAHSGQRGDAS